MKFFDADGPLMQGLSKMADLMILDLIALVCCIPIVTIGASMTALYYMALKIVRNEEVYIVKGFFKSFKQNFRQATIIWLIQIVAMVILGLDAYIMYANPETKPHVIMQVLFMATTLLGGCTFLFIYPVLSKFDNTIARTFKNTFIMAIMQMPKILLMAVMWALPVIIAVFFIQVFPLVVLFGLSLPALGCAKLYNKFFKRMEDQMIARAIAAGEIPADPGSEDEHIFSDEVIPEVENSRNQRNSQNN